MRISLNWLRELVNINQTPEELAQTLTMAGFEVEDIEDLHKNADGVVVGKVIDCQPHKNADKLRVCKVDIGNPTLSNIVCGAQNVRADIYVAVATLGTYLPAVDLTISPVEKRGVHSEGMICSLAELGLEKDSQGIHIFSGDNLTLGSDVRPLLGLNDVILDLTATANRADALSMIGVALEVAALTGASLNLPQVPSLSIPTSDYKLKVTISDTQACPAYFATVIEGVKIASSPDWLKSRLKAAGVRPINNVVDVTNYILLEWGQPLHAFDRERLYSLTEKDSLTIGVRFANTDESIVTLDGLTRSLVSQNLLITANDRPVAIAGVMGGQQTEVYEGTTNIILEAALFNSVTIRRSSRSVSLRSESSTRYERGVNQAEFNLALNRAIALISELSGGTPTQQVSLDARPEQTQWTRSIELRAERINQILGPVKTGKIQPEDVEIILSDLGCKLEKVEGKTDVWTVTVPPYRYRDLEREIDLIEEVARLYGYDKFLEKLPSKTEAGYLSREEKTRRAIRAAFCAVGLTEVVHYSLVKPKQAEITLANPLFTEYSALRTNLIDGLIDAFEYNQSQGNGALNAFEIGRIFWRDSEKLQEADAIGGIIGGDRTFMGRWVSAGKNSHLTWYEAKGILETVFERLSVKVEYIPYKDDQRLHPGRTASLSHNGKDLGIFGQLHPQLCKIRDLPEAVYVFQLNFNVLLETLSLEELITPHFRPYSTLPALERDIAFFAPTTASVAEIEKVITQAGGDLLTKVELFDQYQGENVPKGQRSLAFSLLYRGSDRTLTDLDVEPIHEKVRSALVEKFNVTLRS